MHVVVNLFLPMEVKEEDEFVEDLIDKMDTNKDGKIGYPEFVKYVKDAGNANFLSA